MVTAANQKLPPRYRISDDEFDKLAAACRLSIDGELDGSSDDCMPKVIVQVIGMEPDAKPSLEWNTLAVPFNTPEQKRHAMRSIGARLIEPERIPQAVFLISEAWTSRQRADEPRKYAQAGDDPERREVLLYMGMTNDGRHRHGFREIKRDAKGLMTAAADWSITPADAKCVSPLVAQVYLGLADAALIRSAMRKAFG